MVVVVGEVRGIDLGARVPAYGSRLVACHSRMPICVVLVSQ